MTEEVFDRDSAEQRYNDYMHIIEVGAYSEYPPEEDCDEEWESDGSYWYGSTNITEAIEALEAAADSEDLKFRSTTPYKANTQMTYILVPLTPEEIEERSRRMWSMSRAALIAGFKWQDHNKIVLNYGCFLVGRLQTETPTYIVEVDAEVREDDPMMNYSWDESQTFTVRWSADEEKEPAVSEITPEEIAQAKFFE